MDHEVAEFVSQLYHVPVIDRLDNFVRFLNEAVPDGLMGLFPVPGAFLPESSDNCDEFFETIPGFLLSHESSLSRSPGAKRAGPASARSAVVEMIIVIEVASELEVSYLKSNLDKNLKP
jgi:hypothetical protein